MKLTRFWPRNGRLLFVVTRQRVRYEVRMTLTIRTTRMLSGVLVAAALAGCAVPAGTSESAGPDGGAFAFETDIAAIRANRHRRFADAGSITDAADVNVVNDTGTTMV